MPYSFTNNELEFFSKLKSNDLIEKLIDLTDKGNSFKIQNVPSNTALQRKAMQRRPANSKSFNIRSKNNDNFKSSFHTTMNETDKKSKKNKRGNVKNMLNKAGSTGKIEESDYTKGFGDEKTKISANSTLAYRKKDRYRNMSGNFVMEGNNNSENIMSLKSANFEKCKKNNL